jgi:hypothetical protein
LQPAAIDAWIDRAGAAFGIALLERLLFPAASIGIVACTADHDLAGDPRDVGFLAATALGVGIGGCARFGKREVDDDPLVIIRRFCLRECGDGQRRYDGEPRERRGVRYY